MHYIGKKTKQIWINSQSQKYISRHSQSLVGHIMHFCCVYFQNLMDIAGNFNKFYRDLPVSAMYLPINSKTCGSLTRARDRNTSWREENKTIPRGFGHGRQASQSMRANITQLKLSGTKRLQSINKSFTYISTSRLNEEIHTMKSILWTEKVDAGSTRYTFSMPHSIRYAYMLSGYIVLVWLIVCVFMWYSDFSNPCFFAGLLSPNASEIILDSVLLQLRTFWLEISLKSNFLYLIFS